MDDSNAAVGVSFGMRLRRTRRAASGTHAELAERAGVSVRSISDLERDVAHTPMLAENCIRAPSSVGTVSAHSIKLRR